MLLPLRLQPCAPHRPRPPNITLPITQRPPRCEPQACSSANHQPAALACRPLPQSPPTIPTPKRQRPWIVSNPPAPRALPPSPVFSDSVPLRLGPVVLRSPFMQLPFFPLSVDSFAARQGGSHCLYASLLRCPTPLQPRGMHCFDPMPHCLHFPQSTPSLAHPTRAVAPRPPLSPHHHDTRNRPGCARHQNQPSPTPTCLRCFFQHPQAPFCAERRAPVPFAAPPTPSSPLRT